MNGILPLLVRLLAVAGGAALGWLAITFLVGLLRRFLGVQSVPRPLYLIARALGAIAAGWVTWLWLSGSGGGSVGGPGGVGIGGAPGSSGSTGATRPRAMSSAPSEDADTLIVVVLGGKQVENERVYRAAGKNLTLNELKAFITERQASGLQRLKIIADDNSVWKDSPAVEGLHKWAKDHNVTVLLPPEEKAR
jgi:hypothetical protein